MEKAPRSYNWAGYKQLFEMLRSSGLKVQVVLSFHACGGNVGDLAEVPLPAWVLEVSGTTQHYQQPASPAAAAAQAPAGSCTLRTLSRNPGCNPE